MILMCCIEDFFVVLLCGIVDFVVGIGECGGGVVDCVLDVFFGVIIQVLCIVGDLVDEVVDLLFGVGCYVVCIFFDFVFDVVYVIFDFVFVYDFVFLKFCGSGCFDSGLGVEIDDFAD